MTRSSTSYTIAGGSVAAYKGYAGAISAQLNAVLTKTADTGQVDFNTVATEPTTVRDFEVFAFTGALQATNPLFVRFDYQGGTSTSTNKISCTVGTSTDGAGVIGGITVPLSSLHGGWAPTNQTRYCYASSDGESYLTLVYNINTAGSGFEALAGCVIERTRNADGTPNGDGYMCWRWYANESYASNGSTNYFGGLYTRSYAGGTQPPLSWDYGALIPNLYNSSTYFSGDTAHAFPVYGSTGVRPTGASKALLIGVANDFPRDSEITLTHYGTPMKFFSLGSASTATNVATMAAATTASFKTGLGPLFRWE